MGGKIELTLLKAIRSYCFECCEKDMDEVELCPVEDCPLYLYRLDPDFIAEKERLKVNPYRLSVVEQYPEISIQRFGRDYPPDWLRIRFAVLQRDNFRCQYCGRNPTEHQVMLHVDHIKPRIDGGSDTIDNLVTACLECNLSKSARPLRCEAMFKTRIIRSTR